MGWGVWWVMAEVDEADGPALGVAHRSHEPDGRKRVGGEGGPEVAGPLAFSSFYDGHRNRIASALALTVRSASLGAEAADEALARAYADWGRVSVMANPAGWVYRVGLNWATSLLRRRRREELGVDLAAVARDDQRVDVDLERALAGLSVDHRAVVVARHLLGFSTADTAAALEIAEGTVKSRLARALDHLRSELEGTHG